MFAKSLNKHPIGMTWDDSGGLLYDIFTIEK